MQREIVFPSPTLESRYWSHVDQRGPDECWPWTAYTSRGYGKIWVGYDADGRAIMRRANRVGWAIIHGKDPGRQHVRHICDNPSCCNPSHWELGSHADNMQDMQSRGRANHPRGESVGGAKLTEPAVLDIVVLRAQGHTLKSIARQHGVSFVTVQKILTGATWSHITGLPRVRRLAPVPHQKRDCSGASNNFAKLSEDDVRAIRASTGMTQAQIAEKFSVSQATVSRILSGKRWA